jgi:Putative ATPase subunit of terminase (gpP-like)
VLTEDFAQLQLQFVDQAQWRYEVIRPMVLFADRTPRQRADETDTHPATVRTLTRRFRQQGIVGLLREEVEIIVRARAPRVPEAVRQELDRLKALYDGFHYRELARILFVTCGVSIDHKTVKALWQASAVACQGHLGLWNYHAQPDRYHARLQAVRLYFQGWDKVSISRFLHVTRPTVDTTLAKITWVCAILDEEKSDGLPRKSPCHNALACLLP